MHLFFILIKTSGHSRKSFWIPMETCGILWSCLEVSGKGDSTAVIAGTHGYIAPEYVYTFRMSEKSEVYNFEIVLMELVIGKTVHGGWVSRERGNCPLDFSQDFLRRECISSFGEEGLWILWGRDDEGSYNFIAVHQLSSCTKAASAGPPSLRIATACQTRVRFQISSAVEAKVDGRAATEHSLMDIELWRCFQNNVDVSF